MQDINKREEHTNILNKYINKIVPQIMDILNNNIKLKVDYTLTKKCNDLINNIIGYKKRPSNIRCYIDTSSSSGLLKLDISYSEGYGGKEHSSFTTYIKDYVYLWTNDTQWDSKTGNFYIKETKLSTSFNKRPVKTLNQVLNVINKSKKLDNKIELLNNKKNDLKRGFNNYLAK